MDERTKMEKLRRFCFRKTAERAGKAQIVKTEKILDEKSRMTSWKSKRDEKIVCLQHVNV